MPELLVLNKLDLAVKSGTATQFSHKCMVIYLFVYLVMHYLNSSWPVADSTGHWSLPRAIPDFLVRNEVAPFEVQDFPKAF